MKKDDLLAFKCIQPILFHGRNEMLSLMYWRVVKMIWADFFKFWKECVTGATFLCVFIHVWYMHNTFLDRPSTPTSCRTYQ